MIRSMRSAGLLALALSAGMMSTSCFGLDGFLFTGTPEDSYTLPYPPNWPANFTVPETMREVRSVTGADGTVAWIVWLHHDPAMTATVPTILYSHGQSANIDRYYERASLLWGLGNNVVIYDYPGYGKTPGHPTETSCYATANAAMGFIQGLGAQIDQTKIFQYGFSMGTGLATHMAAFGPRVRGLILEAPFTSVDALVADGALVVPASFLINASFNNLAKIVRAAQNTQNGVLIFHGTHDTYVQTKYGRQLDQALADAEANGDIPPMHHHLELIDGADHSEVPCVGPGDNPCVLRPLNSPYFVQLQAFLAR